MASPGHISSVDGCNAADAQYLDVLGSPVLGSVTNNQHLCCVSGVKKSSAVVVSGSLTRNCQLKDAPHVDKLLQNRPRPPTSAQEDRQLFFGSEYMKVVVFILMHPAEFCCIVAKRKHNILIISYQTLQHVSVRMNKPQALLCTAIEEHTYN